MATPPTSLVAPEHDQQRAGIEHPIILGVVLDVLRHLLEVENVESAVISLDLLPGNRRRDVGAGLFEVFDQRRRLLHHLGAVGVTDVQRGIVVGRDQRERIDPVLTVGAEVGKLEPLVQRGERLGDAGQLRPLSRIEKHEVRLAPTIATVLEHRHGWLW